MNSAHQLKALTKKNFILWKRNPCCSLCEIILPVLLCCLLFIMRSYIEINKIEPKSYVTDNETLYKFNIFN